MSKTHYLKTWPQHFKEVKHGKKRLEVRKNDRNFKTNDFLMLQEYIPEEDNYTGLSVFVKVEYILHGPAFGLKKGFVAMSISEL